MKMIESWQVGVHTNFRKKVQGSFLWLMLERDTSGLYEETRAKKTTEVSKMNAGGCKSRCG